MWLTTTRGFYSAVQHRDDPNDLLIRARNRDDLVRLCELPGMPGEDMIQDIQPADYPYRITVRRHTWVAHVLPALMNEVDYDNFKNAVKDRMPGPEGKRRANIYMRVWSAMLSVTPDDDPSRARKYDYPSLWSVEADDLSTSFLEPEDFDLDDPWGPLEEGNWLTQAPTLDHVRRVMDEEGCTEAEARRIIAREARDARGDAA